MTLGNTHLVILDSISENITIRHYFSWNHLLWRRVWYVTITLCDTTNYVTVTLCNNHKTYVTSIFAEITFRNSDFLWKKPFVILSCVAASFFFYPSIYTCWLHYLPYLDPMFYSVTHVDCTILSSSPYIRQSFIITALNSSFTYYCVVLSPPLCHPPLCVFSATMCFLCTVSLLSKCVQHHLHAGTNVYSDFFEPGQNLGLHWPHFKACFLADTFLQMCQIQAGSQVKKNT